MFRVYMGGVAMRIAASKASGSLEDLIEQVNQDHIAVEITSQHGDAVSQT